jgi:hypothetical protein
MNNFAAIKIAFQQAGIDVQSAGYSFTPYSLNTPLSFKFENISELLAFLGIDASASAKTEHITTMLAEAGLDPNTFFYVNFYKPKVAEL